MQAKRKVLHIIKSLGRGGAETLLPETLKYHNKEAYEFHYIYFLPWKDQMVGAIAQNGGIVTCLAASNNIQIFFKIRSVVQYIRHNNIQLVHCHLPWAGIAGRIAGRLSGIPVIYTEHNNFFRYHGLTRLFSRLTLNLNNLIIPVSKDAEQALAKVVRHHKVHLILNGVDTVSFSRQPNGSDVRQQLNIPEDNVVVVTAAVFRKQKRIDLFMRVAAGVLSKYNNVSFIIIGDGPLKEEIYELADQLGLKGKVHFTGLQKDVKPYFNISDIYLMSSDFEGLPIALLEAMSMSCAPVATKVGGIPEVIEDGISGFLCESGDKEALQNRIEGLISNVSQRKAIAANARKRIEQHLSLQKMVLNLEEVYSQVCTHGSFDKSCH